MRSVLVIWLENGQPVYYSNRDMWARGGGACHERPTMHASSIHKDPTFPYILLPTQEVRIYFVAVITLRHALVRKRSTYERLLCHVCVHITFSTHSTTARLCICERGGTAKGHRIMEVSNTLQPLRQRSICCRSRKYIRGHIPMHAIFCRFYLFFHTCPI